MNKVPHGSNLRRGRYSLLVVCYTYRDENTIRLISARNAVPRERKIYEG